MNEGEPLSEYFMRNQDYWSDKLEERKTRLAAMLAANAPDSMIETECLLVLIAINKGTLNAFSEISQYMLDLLRKDEEFTNILVQNVSGRIYTQNRPKPKKA